MFLNINIHDIKYKNEKNINIFKLHLNLTDRKFLIVHIIDVIAAINNQILIKWIDQNINDIQFIIFTFLSLVLKKDIIDIINHNNQIICPIGLIEYENIR